jgi:RNA polymerase sporulation-specific sigma factor
MEVRQMTKNVFTDYQKSLVEDNIRLAYFMAAKWYKRINFEIELEEINSLCLLGLTKAALRFDIGRQIKFSTYSIRCMDNEILMTIRQPIYKLSTIAVSKLESFCDEGEYNLWDFLQSKLIKNDNVEDWLNEFALNEILDKLPLQTKNILDLYVSGQKQVQIGKTLGISQSYVCRLATRGRKMILKEYDYSENGIKFRRVKMRENICNKCKYKEMSGGKMPCNICYKIIGKNGENKFELKEKKDA